MLHVSWDSNLQEATSARCIVPMSLVQGPLPGLFATFLPVSVAPGVCTVCRGELGDALGARLCGPILLDPVGPEWLLRGGPR